MIEIKEVNRQVKGVDILRNINLEFKRGEMTFIVGPSGAGKTSLLNVIGGLVKDFSGLVNYDGFNIKKDMYAYRSKSVGYIFQDYNLVEGMSVRDNIILGSELSNIDIDEEEYKKLILDMKIKSEKQKIETLSGGEKQRVAIIRSILTKSDIILADEPTGNLDSVNSIEVFELLKKMSVDRYVIIVTHDKDMAERYADRIITIEDGCVKEDVKKRSDASSVSDNAALDVGVRNHSVKKKLSAVKRVGNNSIRKRFRRLISITISLVVAASCISMVYSMINIGRKTVEGTSINFLESDLINVSYRNNQLKAGSRLFEIKMTDADKEKLKNTYKAKEIVPLYYYTTSGWEFSLGDQRKDADFKVINIDEFFKKRIMGKDIEGEFPKNDYEVILAEDVADELLDGEKIGKKIWLRSPDSDTGIEVTVVGINKGRSSDETIKNYVSSDLLKEIKEKDISEALDKRVMTGIKVDEKSIIGGPVGALGVSKGDEDFVWGRAISSDNEIIISDASCNDPSIKDYIESGRVNTNPVILDYNGSDSMMCVGVFKSDKEEIRVSAGYIERLKNASPLAFNIYVSDVKDVQKIVDDINTHEEFGALARELTLKKNVLSATNMLYVVLEALAVIIVLITFVMVSSYATMCVLERRKEIGIVKSLGADSLCIKLITMYDIGFMFLACVIGSYFVSNILYTILSMTVLRVEGTFYYCPFYVTLVTSVALSVVYGIMMRIKLGKLIKAAPADLLKG